MQMKKMKLILGIGLILLIPISGCANSNNNTARLEEEITDDEKNIDSKDKSDIVIGYSISSEAEPFAELCKERILTVFNNKHPEWKIIVKSSDFDINIEAENTKSFIENECDIIIYHAVDTNDSVNSIEMCNRAGIPCITIVNEVSDGKRIHIGGNNYACGQLIAEYVHDSIPENGRLCILMGPAGSTNSADRVKGFKDSLDREDVIVLDEQCGDWMEEKGKAIMQDWIATYDDIDMVFSCSDTMTPGALDALKEAGKLNNTIVTSVDCSFEGLSRLAKGEMTCDMLYNTLTIADRTMDTCERILLGDTDIEDYYFPFELINQSNAKEVMNWYFSE